MKKYSFEFFGKNWIFVFFLVFASGFYAGGIKDFLRKTLAPVLDLSEKTLGQVVRASMKLQYKEMKLDEQTKSWIYTIFDKVAAVSDRKDIDYDLTVVDGDFVNAFAVPGGHIYVSKGLLNKLKSDDELASVLGHEIGHVAARHSMKNIEHQIAWMAVAEYARKKSSKAADMMSVYQMFSSLRYSRKNEMEADSLGARYAAAAGFNPRGMENFLRILEELDENDRDPSRLEIALATHPPEKRRIQAMMEYTSTLNPEILSRPTRLSYDFSAKYPVQDKKTQKKDQDSKNQTAIAAKTAKSLVWDFEKEGSSGVASGFVISQQSGILVLDLQKKKSGNFSQKIRTVVTSATSTLVSSSPLQVFSGRHYRLRAWIHTENLSSSGDPMGSGAGLTLREYSSRSLVHAHPVYGCFNGSSKDFQEIVIDFKTHKDTTLLSLEFGIFKARGSAWFDNFSLEEILEPLK